jgi:hypothetical protein
MLASNWRSGIGLAIAFLLLGANAGAAHASSPLVRRLGGGIGTIDAPLRFETKAPGASKQRKAARRVVLAITPKKGETPRLAYLRMGGVDVPVLPAIKRTRPAIRAATNLVMERLHNRQFIRRVEQFLAQRKTGPITDADIIRLQQPSRPGRRPR